MTQEMEYISYGIGDKGRKYERHTERDGKTESEKEREEGNSEREKGKGERWKEQGREG